MLDKGSASHQHFDLFGIYVKPDGFKANLAAAEKKRQANISKANNTDGR